MFTIKVADNFHYMDDSETYTLGTFPSLEEAVQRSKEIVAVSYTHLTLPTTSRV